MIQDYEKELSWRFTTDGPVYSSPFVAMIEGSMSCHTMCNARPRDKHDTQVAAFALSSVGNLYILDFYLGVLFFFHCLVKYFLHLLYSTIKFSLVVGTTISTHLEY